MNTCILNPYISQGLRLLLCCIMQWLVDCVFHLEFYLIGYICNQRKQLWLVTDASKAKYLPNKKTLFSISISIQLNSSSLNRSCSFISVRGERDRIWLSIPALTEMVPCKRNCTRIPLEKDSSAAYSPDLFHLSGQEQRALQHPACQLQVKCKVFIQVSMRC